MQKEETELDFNDDVDYTRRAGIFKQAGVTVLILLVAAGLSGVLGFGLWTTVKTGNTSFSLQYERFLHAKKETRMKAFITNPTDSLVRIFISAAYFEKAHIDKIIPDPVRTSSSEGGITYTFAAKGPVEIVFLFVSEKAGKQEARIRNGNTELTIKQFIYP
jgi:hypothetical protein